MGYGGTFRVSGRRYTARFTKNKAGEVTGFKQVVYEHDYQAEVIRWAKKVENIYPELWLLHAIPNGGKRNKGVAKKLKAEGVKAGVPDLFLPVARGQYHGLYIEMKNETGVIRDTQKIFQQEVEKQGYKVITCYSDMEAIEGIAYYLNLIMPVYGHYKQN